MNYAAQYHIGYSQIAPTNKAAQTAQATGRVFQLDATTKGRQRGAKRQTKGSTDRHAADGFLKCSFLPKLAAQQTTQDSTEADTAERDFYQSLSQLAAHYHIQPMQSRQYGYPYNISLALNDVKRQLKKEVINWQQIELIQDGSNMFLTTEEKYNTGASLYYIPIVPLFRLSKNPNRKNAAQLLQSVCSYLYHIADIPYYRQEDSYLSWMYEMIIEWIVTDEAHEDTPTHLSEILQAQLIGDIMEQKIFNNHNLSRFEIRLKHFKAADSFEGDCYKVAREAFNLYQQYPNATIYRNAQSIDETEDEERENIVSMDKYVSFCADAKGLLFQNLFDSVNTEFQECAVMDEPTIVKRFDGSPVHEHSLEFESRVFAMIEELICLLNSIKT